MKKLIMAIAAATFLISCEVQKPLYSWYNYSDASYNYIKKSDEKSTNDLVESYKKIIAKQEGTRGLVPPGIYADYAFLLMKQNKNTEAQVMLEKEIELYPESKIFMDRIIKMAK
jgi:hypothetical protein